MAEGSGATYFLVPTTSPDVHYRAATTGKALSIGYGTISLSYPPTLAKVLGSEVTATTVLAYGGIPQSPVGPNPNYIKFTFGKVDPQQLYNLPTLSIYKVDAINKLSSDDQALVGSVSTFLSAQANLTDVKEIPVYPSQMAGQVFHAQSQYLTSPSTTLVRFVTHYAQDVGPLTGDALKYIAVGLSSDGAYYLILQVPITTAALDGNDKLLPDLSDPNAGNLYDTYVKQTVQKLDNAAPPDFSPNLNDLDTLLQSITFSDVKAS